MCTEEGDEEKKKRRDTVMNPPTPSTYLTSLTLTLTLTSSILISTTIPLPPPPPPTQSLHHRHLPLCRSLLISQPLSQHSNTSFTSSKPPFTPSPLSSPPLPPPPPPSAPCLFNFLHRLPPESLFRHSLQCPSSPSPLLNLGPLLLQSLCYPNTLKPPQQLFNQNCVLQTVQDPNSDLCFSLDDYCDFGPNFFYPMVPNQPKNNSNLSSITTVFNPSMLSASTMVVQIHP